MIILGCRRFYDPEIIKKGLPEGFAKRVFLIK